MNEIERQKQAFREADAKRKAQIDELCNSDDLLDMSTEIASLKVLIREAREMGQTSVVEKLTATLNRLIKDERQLRINKHELVSKACMRRWGQRVEELLEDAFRDQFDGWELALRAFRYSMARALAEAVNSDSELKALL